MITLLPEIPDLFYKYMPPEEPVRIRRTAMDRIRFYKDHPEDAIDEEKAEDIRGYFGGITAEAEAWLEGHTLTWDEMNIYLRCRREWRADQ